MFNIFNRTIKSSHEKRRLFENIFSLSVLQATNYILPLITLPYLVRVLGAEKFGVIAFAGAFIQYFVILTDYGFGLSATRQISINRDNQEKLSSIFSAVIIIKILFMILCALMLTLVLLLIPKFQEDLLVYILSFGMVFDNVLFPVWFFQGIENMKYITIRNVIAKVLFTVLIFFFVHNSHDYYYVPLLNSLGMIAVGIVGLIPVFTKYHISLRIPSYQELTLQIYEGWHVFTSKISINAYTTSNTFILGLFSTNEIVGYYSAAFKIFNAIQSLCTPIATALYPYFSKKINDDIENAKIKFRKLFYYTLIITFFISLALTLSSSLLVQLLLGKNYEKSVLILSILSWVIFSSWGNYTLGIQGLINFGYKKIFSKYVMTGAIIHILLLFITINIFGYLIVPVIWFLTESIIFIFEYRFLVKKRILLSLKEIFVCKE